LQILIVFNSLERLLFKAKSRNKLLFLGLKPLIILKIKRENCNLSNNSKRKSIVAQKNMAKTATDTKQVGNFEFWLI